jgi:hypothetical protein
LASSSSIAAGQGTVKWDFDANVRELARIAGDVTGADALEGVSRYPSDTGGRLKGELQKGADAGGDCGGRGATDAFGNG